MTLNILGIHTEHVPTYMQDAQAFLVEELRNMNSLYFLDGDYQLATFLSPKYGPQFFRVAGAGTTHIHLKSDVHSSLVNLQYAICHSNVLYIFTVCNSIYACSICTSSTLP
jgi:hypothetical protein